MSVEVLASPTGFEDWGEVHALLALCFAPMEGRIDPPSSLGRMTSENLAEVGEKHHFVVARAEGMVIGFGLAEVRETSLYLSKLAVHPDWRGQGLLRSVLTCFEGVARIHTLRKLTLQTRFELVENHAIFNALGFQKTDETRHPGYDRVTSYTFSKLL